jgi:flavin reductase (DIM6/NTAB) family NADH-FMN oxidoreductase RutF
MLFDFAKLSTKDCYKVLSFTVVPRPIAWVTSLGVDGRRNAAPFSFFNVVATDPPTIVLGVTANSPHGKDTSRHIVETGEFVVNLVPHKLIHEMNLTGVQFDPSIDELDEASLSVLPSTFVTVPRIAESPVSLECVKSHVHALDSGQFIILGRVLGVHIVDEAVKDAGKCYIDTRKLDLVGRMNDCYVRTTDLYDVPRISLEDWKARRGIL